MTTFNTILRPRTINHWPTNSFEKMDVLLNECRSFGYSGNWVHFTFNGCTTKVLSFNPQKRSTGIRSGNRTGHPVDSPRPIHLKWWRTRTMLPEMSRNPVVLKPHVLSNRQKDIFKKSISLKRPHTLLR